ncbi:MAG: permease-like cell division protein FtsX [Bacteroidota bacterium]
MIGFYISESFKSILRAKLATAISIITLSITIGFIGLSTILLLLSNKIEKSWKDEIKMNVFLNDSVSTKQINLIEDTILSNNLVKRAKYLSKDDAEKLFLKITGEDFQSILDVNPLPNSFTVTFNTKINKENIASVIDEFSSIIGVDEVIYDYNLTLTILEFLRSMKILVFIVTLVFIAIAIYLLYSTSRLILQHKMEQYNTMKLVGARLSTIKVPLLIYGLIVGILASLICVSVLLSAKILLHQYYPTFQFDNYFNFINLGFVILGLILGPIGVGLFAKKLSLKIENFN